MSYLFWQPDASLAVLEAQMMQRVITHIDMDCFYV
jgi:hypothetical protein